MGLLTLPVSASPSAPATKAAPQGPPLPPIYRIPDVLLKMILTLADDVRAASTSKDFRLTTNALIKREWERFNLALTPNFNTILSSRLPKTGADLNTLYNGILQKCTATENPALAVRAKTQIAGSFRPLSFQRLEAAAKQAESDRNLKLIWPRIAAELGLPGNPMTISDSEIKNWLRTHPALLLTLEELDLSRLGLTMIPDEIASLALPNLTTLHLHNNKLASLPEGFGANWPLLRILSLSNNQLQSLPANFGAGWNRLIQLALQDNHLRSLPANFGTDWNRLVILMLYGNQLSSFPEGFGNNWNQLLQLLLSSNQLSSFPEGFGNNWNRLQYLTLSNNRLSSFREGFGNNWNQLEHLILSHNRLSSFPESFGARWNQLKSLELQHNQISLFPVGFGANWHWWRSQYREIWLKGNPILDLPAFRPLPTPQQQPQKALLSASAVHILSTAALVAIATYAIGWKIPAAVGAVYLSRQYMRGDLWAF